MSMNEISCEIRSLSNKIIFDDFDQTIGTGLSPASLASGMIYIF